MDRAEIYFSIADEVASAMVSLKFIAIIRGKCVRDIFMISGVFWILSLEMLPTFTFYNTRYIVLPDKECFNFSFLIVIDYLIEMDIPRSSTNLKINTALTNLRPSQSCPNFIALGPTAALANAFSNNFNTSSPVQSNYNLRRVLAGSALVQTNTNSSETSNQIFSYIVRQAALNENLINNNLVDYEEFSGATARRNNSNGDLEVEYVEASFEERFGMFRRESLEDLLPFMTMLPITYNLANGNFGITNDDNSNSSTEFTSSTGNDSDSTDLVISDSRDNSVITNVNEPENSIVDFRNMVRTEFGVAGGAHGGGFRPRNIYDRDLARYGRGRGYWPRSIDLSSNNETPSNESFVGRGRGVIGRGRGFYDTTTSSFSGSTEYTDSRAGRGLRRGLDLLRFGGRGVVSRRTWSSSMESNNGCWAGISGA